MSRASKSARLKSFVRLSDRNDGFYSEKFRFDRKKGKALWGFSFFVTV